MKILGFMIFFTARRVIMTTIAYHHKDKQVAVDSRVCSGNVISTDNYNKSIKNSSGTWFLCGCICDIEDFVNLKKNVSVDKSLNLEVSGLRVSEDVVYYVFMNEGIFCEEVQNYDIALGSGRDFALAAMDHGKSAKEAIKYAMTRDNCTGGRIRVFNVGVKS